MSSGLALNVLTGQHPITVVMIS